MIKAKRTIEQLNCTHIATAEQRWMEVKTMSVEQMRAILKKQYNGACKWVNKVNNMHDEQVIAVYNRMLYAHQLK